MYVPTTGRLSDDGGYLSCSKSLTSEHYFLDAGHQPTPPPAPMQDIGAHAPLLDGYMSVWHSKHIKTQTFGAQFMSYLRTDNSKYAECFSWKAIL